MLKMCAVSDAIATPATKAALAQSKTADAPLVKRACSGAGDGTGMFRGANKRRV